MDQNKIDLFVATMNEKFPADKVMAVRTQLETLNDSKFPVLQSLDYKTPINMLIISWFLGIFGVDRFMLGQTAMGIFKLITLGGCGIWALIDLFLIMGATREYNYKLFAQNAI